MFTLLVSEDLGIHYDEEAKGENIEDFKPRMVELDKNLIRWVVEDDKERIIVVCNIFAGILTGLSKQPNAMMITEDNKLIKCMNQLRS